MYESHKMTWHPHARAKGRAREKARETNETDSGKRGRGIMSQPRPDIVGQFYQLTSVAATHFKP